MAKYAVVALWCVAAGLSGQAPAPAAPHIARGRQVEAVQRELGTRVARFHEALAADLRKFAPDLLPKLAPPPPIATGYQLLPRIVAVPPQSVAAPPPLVSYGWRWSETLMARETAVLEQLEAALLTTSGRRSALDSLTTSYRSLTDRKRLVDADVNYNWLWQAEIARQPAVFDRSTAVQNAILRRRGPQTSEQRSADSALIAAGLASGVERVDPPDYLRFEQRGTEWTITVPMVTDIQDTAFLAEFTRVIAIGWRARDSAMSYRVVVDLRVISPEELYCKGSAVPCAPPARGAAITLGAHIGRFPQSVAVLTTGAGSTHFTGGRAVVLSSHDAPRHVLVHEFGHALGFRDAYLRGYRDAGNDGFTVTELVVDATDLMGNSRDGVVTARHFHRLLKAKEAPVLMKAALVALYDRNNAREAVPLFRKVLDAQPNHYGAMFQLAKALDASGAPAEAKSWWERVLIEARIVGDSATARTAATRASSASAKP